MEKARFLEAYKNLYEAFRIASAIRYKAIIEYVIDEKDLVS